jgi:hypothetical protein
MDELDRSINVLSFVNDPVPDSPILVAKPEVRPPFGKSGSNLFPVQLLRHSLSFKTYLSDFKK